MSFRKDFEVKSLADVRQSVEKIRRLSYVQWDCEGAHSLEDELYRAAMRAAIRREPESIQMLELALTTQEFDFARWCA